MAFQTELLVADLNEAQDVADSGTPLRKRVGFSFTGFDRVQLCTLLSLIKSENSETCFDHYLDAVGVVRSSMGDWPVVTVVKQAEVDELSAVASL